MENNITRGRKIIGKPWNEIKHTARNSQMEKPCRGPVFQDGMMELYIYACTPKLSTKG
jgi:hypothetical protein